METRKKLTIAAIAVAAFIAGGALSAAAAPTVAATAQLIASVTPSASPDGDGGRHERNGVGEEELTGDVADQVRAAVEAEYPDAAIERLETDADGDAYEAHIRQADGTRATVKLDESYNITGLEEGHGGGRGHRGDCDRDSGDATGTAAS